MAPNEPSGEPVTFHVQEEPGFFIERSLSSLTFDPVQESSDSFVFTLAVKPVGADSPLVVALEFNI